MLKYIRIAVTALSLTACVLLIALWVRSYYWRDYIGSRIGFLVDSVGGSVVLFDLSAIDQEAKLPLFEAMSFRADDWWVPPGNNLVEIPHWLLVLLTGTIAAAPWLPKRFSLRTLLIATTLVAVGLGLIVAAT